MKRKNDFLQGTGGAMLIIMLLVAVALWAAFNLLKSGDDRVQQRVSVIVEDSNNERWTAFRLGLDQAAAEYGVDVTFVTSNGFSSAEEQKNLIARIGDRRADPLSLRLGGDRYCSRHYEARFRGNGRDQVQQRRNCRSHSARG